MLPICIIEPEEFLLQDCFSKKVYSLMPCIFTIRKWIVSCVCLTAARDIEVVSNYHILVPIIYCLVMKKVVGEDYPSFFF